MEEAPPKRSASAAAAARLSRRRAEVGCRPVLRAAPVCGAVSAGGRGPAGGRARSCARGAARHRLWSAAGEMETPPRGGRTAAQPALAASPAAARASPNRSAALNSTLSSRPGLSSTGCTSSGPRGSASPGHRADTSGCDYLPCGEGASPTGRGELLAAPAPLMPPDLGSPLPLSDGGRSPPGASPSPAAAAAGARPRRGAASRQRSRTAAPAPGSAKKHADPGDMRTPPPVAQDLARARRLMRKADVLPSPLRTPARRGRQEKPRRDSTVAHPGTAARMRTPPPLNASVDLNESLRPCRVVFDSPDGRSPLINGHKMTEERQTPQRKVYPLRLDLSPVPCGAADAAGPPRFDLDQDLEDAVLSGTDALPPRCSAPSPPPESEERSPAPAGIDAFSPAPSSPPPPPPRRAPAPGGPAPHHGGYPSHHAAAARCARRGAAAAAAAMRSARPPRPLPRGVLAGTLVVSQLAQPAAQVPAERLRHIPAPPKMPPPARLPPGKLR
eukprot:TRINITY_DN27534_c0_g1_i1.p1 TRINITY_DN27534_c0_g1~~TRINITY_DN27534_c0_g1_i1.p1  ORF type:complete len:501 (+),score=105.00 TRINITY_DN27534_c0_g1_i1:61-1563(+)